jgi:hypothetical protein
VLLAQSFLEPWTLQRPGLCAVGHPGHGTRPVLRHAPIWPLGAIVINRFSPWACLMAAQGTRERHSAGLLRAIPRQ